MDEMHNYATPSTSTTKTPNTIQLHQKRRVNVSDDIHIIIKKFRRTSEEGTADDSDGCLDEISGELKDKKDEDTLAAEEKNTLREERARRHDETTNNLQAILEKLTNIESLLKVIADQGTLNFPSQATEVSNQIHSVVQNVPLILNAQHRYLFANKDNTITAHNAVTNVSDIFDFPIKQVEALIELQEQLSENEELAEKMMKFLRKTKYKYDENLGKALTSLVTDEVLFNMNWDGSKGKIQLSSLNLFSNFLYNAWAKEKMNYEEYSSEIKKQLKLSHNRMCKRRSRALSKNDGGSSYENDSVNCV